MARTAKDRLPSVRRGDLDELKAGFAALCANVETLHARIGEMEERQRAPRSRADSYSLNLTTRPLVLKLAHNGQDSRRIAAMLGLPAGEVELLLKITRLQSVGRKAREEAQKQEAVEAAALKHGSEHSIKRVGEVPPPETRAARVAEVPAVSAPPLRAYA